MLRHLLDLLEAAYRNEQLPDDVTVSIVRHVIYGAAPSPAEVALRQRQVHEMADILANQPLATLT